MTLPSARIDELLAAAENCPFCGCEPIGYEIEPHSHALAKFMPDHPGSYVIECPPCDFYMSKPTKAEAIAAWNRRSPPVKAQAEREGEDAEPVAGSLDANELWEFLFGRLKGAVPDELTDEVLSELASHVRSVWPAATLASPLPVEPVTVDEGMVERAARTLALRNDVPWPSDHITMHGWMDEARAALTAALTSMSTPSKGETE